MKHMSKDPLLVAGKLLAMLLVGITGLVTVLFVVLIPVLLLNQGELAAEIAKGDGAGLSTVLPLAIGLLASAAVLVALACYFFRLLGRLIDSVGEGDPFTSVNAERLSLMGWIVLIFHAASVPISILAANLQHAFPAAELTVDLEFSLTGVLLALVLFILARVFRYGAELREDVEGTV